MSGCSILRRHLETRTARLSNVAFQGMAARHSAMSSMFCDLPGTFVRQPIIVNSRGDWLLPVFRCVGLPGERWTGDADTAGVLMSRDAGESWTMTDVPDSLGAVHMNIVPLDGDNLVAFYRNRFCRIRSVQPLERRRQKAGVRRSQSNLPNNNSSIQAKKAER
jgi:predicted neuraminidase